jgi:hypothetical protein
MEKITDFKFSKHAIEQMKRRSISLEVIKNVLLNPEQVKIENDKKVYQSTMENGSSLIRIFVNHTKDPKVVITVYKTSKIKKYYESKI